MILITLRIIAIVGWLIIAILNSKDFDNKSIIIWLATIVIILNNLELIFYNI